MSKKKGKNKKSGNENANTTLVLVTAITNLLIALVDLIKELIRLLN